MTFGVDSTSRTTRDRELPLPCDLRLVGTARSPLRSQVAEGQGLHSLEEYEDRYEKYFEGKKRQQEEETYVMLPPIKTNNCVNITALANILDFPFGVKGFSKVLTKLVGILDKKDGEGDGWGV